MKMRAGSVVALSLKAPSLKASRLKTVWLAVLLLAALCLSGCTSPALAATLDQTAATVPTRPNPYATWRGDVTTIGLSGQGRAIEAYTVGDGPIRVLFVGGIHGGYEWNTVQLAYQFIDSVAPQPKLLPHQFTLTIIPVANPDGLARVVGKTGRFTPDDVSQETVPGRFNGNDVDLNRNWDCHWSPTARWRDVAVSGGDEPFSEPETRVLRDYILATDPTVVVFWHSAAPGVFAAGCDEPFAPSLAMARAYADGAGYPFAPVFNAYLVTGDAGDWLSRQGISSITVELNNRRDTDWEQNLAGVRALLAYLAQ